ncbi:hypothetical protein FHX74_001795 [Friedmanniella endophytica]|uniref:DUF1707 domain-containing protein n=1 Tax=Microlunatus kandeliicorticis TaxID=1759536 RepID=A0A7W3P5T2_9ACTN|nr:DUF1707 domain-containing protein [Microlunatus kandeliicorticis]MBA8794190.1 hypothetical protein [Microlunatus kandeliicorticis]
MDEPTVDNRGLRAGHRDRDAVVDLLREAAAEGRIDLEELDQRIGSALSARTFGELDDLVVDLTDDLPSRSGLPGVPSTAPRSAVPARVPGPPAPHAAGYSAEDPLRLDGGMSSEKRDGVWTVPPFLAINQGFGSVKLNCLAAVAAAPTIMVELTPGAGSVLIILPEGWAADLDRVNKAWGSKSVEVASQPAPGCPVLVFRGSVGFGSVRVRYGRPGELRRAEQSRAALGPA